MERSTKALLSVLAVTLIYLLIFGSAVYFSEWLDAYILTAENWVQIVFVLVFFLGMGGGVLLVLLFPFFLLDYCFAIMRHKIEEKRKGSVSVFNKEAGNKKDPQFSIEREPTSCHSLATESPEEEANRIIMEVQKDLERDATSQTSNVLQQEEPLLKKEVYDSIGESFSEFLDDVAKGKWPPPV